VYTPGLLACPQPRLYDTTPARRSLATSPSLTGSWPAVMPTLSVSGPPESPWHVAWRGGLPPSNDGMP
jgi:hypothetical protein